MNGDEAGRDRWAAWLLERRHGGNEELHRQALPMLQRFRDGVVGGAEVADGDVVLDVGCGDGLIGFAALERVGECGRVIFSDISEELLDVCREHAGGDARCDFVRAAAEDLSAFADGSVDVITTRSVLIYVADKERAVREFFRVLRPGGRLSMFEPINSFGWPPPPGRFGPYDLSSTAELAERVREAMSPAAAGTLTDFDERDLFSWVEDAGFQRITLRYEAEVKPEPFAPGVDWETFRHVAPNPLAPTPQEAMDAALTPEEQDRFAAELRPLVDGGKAVTRMAAAWLVAAKA